MAIEVVDVHVVTDDIVPVDLDGVVVRVYDATGATLITSGTTGTPLPDGHVEFSLNGTAAPTPTTYQLRFYQSGTSFSSPQFIEVYSPPVGSPTGTNTFEIEAHEHVMPEATDPLLCRASAYFVHPDGLAFKGADFHFIYCGKPQMLNARGVLGERRAVRTDATGYASIDLIRGAAYRVTAESLEDTQREVLVPDAPAVNMAHLLFPIITIIDWTPPATLVIGTPVVLEPDVYASDGRLLDGTAYDDLIYAVDDPTVISVLVSSESITLTPLAAGTTTLRVTRRDATLGYAPDPGISGDETSISVS